MTYSTLSKNMVQVLCCVIMQFCNYILENEEYGIISTTVVIKILAALKIKLLTILNFL